VDLLEQALGTLAAAEDKPYFDEAGDRAAAEQYYAGVEPEAAALTTLLERTHRDKPRYSPAVELYPWVDLQPNHKVRSIYTQDEYDPEQLIREDVEIRERRQSLRATAPSEATVEDMEPYNCEHVVPQSWFAHDEPMRGDLHHLFACERTCNSFRGNAHYADFPDYMEVVRERCGKKESETFEPNAGKGPVARATLYFLLRYPALRPYEADPLAMLLRWHEAQPVDDWERHRNSAIFERQGNRNPLIDHPQWAAEIDFSGPASPPA
jgi:endonuclease I